MVKCLNCYRFIIKIKDCVNTIGLFKVLWVSSKGRKEVGRRYHFTEEYARVIITIIVKSSNFRSFLVYSINYLRCIYRSGVVKLRLASYVTACCTLMRLPARVIS